MTLRTLWRALAGEPGGLRQGMAVLAILLGTALGVAVEGINGSAVDAFADAGRQLAHEADLSVGAGRASLSEALYPALAGDPDVLAASPVVEGDLALRCPGAAAHAVHVLGVDALQVHAVDSAVLPGAAAARALLEPGVAMATANARSTLCTGPGPRTVDRLALTAGPAAGTDLRLLATPAPGDAALLVLDIAEAQRLLGTSGQLQRVDLRLRPGRDRAAVQTRLAMHLPAGVQVSTPGGQASRAATLSRAYRANLGVLALIALFTGGFLVFTTQTLSVARLHARIGLLRALGVTRREVLLVLALDGLRWGVAGALPGALAGSLVAAWVLAHLGADLGAGYFAGTHAQYHASASTLALFISLGIACALAGSLAPAWQAAATDPAMALQGVPPRPAHADWRETLPGLLLLAVAGALCLAPPVAGLPLPGYLAIACGLVGLLVLLPVLARLLLAPWRAGGPLTGLALAGLRHRSREAALSLATLVVAVALVAAMAVMVGSFRTSLSTWLRQVLPADIYLRGESGTPGLVTPAVVQALAALPMVTDVDIVRSQPVLLRADLPPVAVLARRTDLLARYQSLAVVAGLAPGSAGLHCALPCAWISEAMVDLYGVHPGDRLSLPLAGHVVTVQVAGVWRDYVRQFGSVVVDRSAYRAWTGDPLGDDAALYVRPGSREQALQATTALLGGALAVPLEIADAHSVVARSLQLFDRSFTVTYALEAVALLIGLLGISAGMGAQALARRVEFGILVHLGATRGQVSRLVACEGLLVGLVGTALGLAAGAVIGVVLVRVVNRQSFHWSLDLSVPVAPLLALALAMLLASTLAALAAARQVLARDAVAAVREGG